MQGTSSMKTKEINGKSDSAFLDVCLQLGLQYQSL